MNPLRTIAGNRSGLCSPAAACRPEARARRKRALFGRIAALLLATPVAAPCASATTFAIDAAHSTLTVKVKKAGLLSGLGHDHTIQTSTLAGRLELDPLRPAATTVSIDIETGSLRVVDTIGPDDKAEIEKTMRDSVMEVHRYPWVRFRSEKVVLQAQEKSALQLTVAGLLTLHGKRRGIVLPVRVIVQADGTLTATGAYRLHQTDYGIEPVSALLGTVTVQNDVEISFRIAARPTGSTPKPGSGETAPH